MYGFLAGVVRLYPVAVPEIFIAIKARKFRPLPTAYFSLYHPPDALENAAHGTLRVPFVQVIYYYAKKGLPIGNPFLFWQG